ncbi:orotidine 5'-phosphate decarboxylase [Alsobacter metallidurans]|uniref:Orotidine 5'-phosphate decarboxylase n=1 Tax=Alsobacter metallidurans TaxID=340221 RepID=A0A917I429_9HYPH|nr:orotidine-5'-phosphate decarboxylase [Alsobacter metallidurans]GGH08157.1 orotidine 5'-phosphate decarboxylase [Alsobacter metallidurans]
MTGAAHPRDRMIVALDLPGVAEAQAMTERLGDTVSFYKVGLELIYAGGLDFAKRLIGDGKKVFLDLKFHDIPNTVSRAAEQVARLGATYLTVHAYPQTMKAAVAATQGSGLTLLAVTVMTSYDDADLQAAGYGMTVKDLVARRARQAQEAGVGGLILSPEELAATRALLGPGMRLVTPGIRPAGASLGDQKRAATPGSAIAAGANALVVGRPITQAQDPRASAQAITAEIAAALA